MNKSETIKSLIQELTLEEKASLLSGRDFWHTKAVDRLGIPEIMVADGPHGLRKQDDKQDHVGIYESVEAICFPAACATACSFDPDLLNEMGHALGEECQAEDLGVLLGPGVNMKRSPLCGRNFEYFSEDPYLAGEMGAAYCNGVQAEGVGVSLKHFAANNQEYRRLMTSAVIDERTFHETYLPSFETVVKKSQPWTVMCSYNRINGEYSSESDLLLNQILRDKWGFEGLVVSDWGAVNDRVKGVPAGLDLEMPGSGGNNDREIVKAVQEGRLSQEAVDLAVSRVLELVFRCVDQHKEGATYDKDAHDALARKIARESMVLLKNNGILPLSETQQIAFIGEFADKPRYQGGGSSHVNAFRITSALDATAGMSNITYAQGYHTDRDEIDEALLQEAVEAAKHAEVAVVFAGLPESFESEGYDRYHMQMPEAQNRLIEEICKVQKNVVVVLHNGASVELPWADSVSALLETYLGGQAVGGASVDLLFGKDNPCGRLAESFPLKLEDNPSYGNFPGTRDSVLYGEGIFIGYRYYDKKKMDVRFPFGHGLSYTSFAYSNLSLDCSEIEDGKPVTVSVTVKNTGNMAGKEVVQVYVSDLENAKVLFEKKIPGFSDRVERPVRELKGFAKVALEPGEEKTVTIELDNRAFSYYDTSTKSWVIPNGPYEVQIGKSSRDIVLSAQLRRIATKPTFAAIHENSLFSDVYELPGGRELVKTEFLKWLTDQRAEDHMLSLYQQPLRIARSFTDGKFTNDMMRHIIQASNKIIENLSK